VGFSQGQVLKGLGVGLVAVSAPVIRILPSQELPAWHRTESSFDVEQAALRSAISSVESDLARLSEGADETSSDIFSALSILLTDEELLEMAEGFLSDGWSAAAAFGMAVNEFAEILGGDPDFDERVKDLQDLSRRVQAHIAGIKVGLDLPLEGRYVLVADDFSPADTAAFTKAVAGVITTSGGPTSHTAIICRARSIAAVVSCPEAADLADGDLVLVDPVGDRVVYGSDVSLATKAISFIDTGAEPLISVRANIGSVEDARKADQTKADGVGLFRTELLYLSTNEQPSRAVQTAKYTEVLSAAPAGPIVVRTIDAGSDKPVPFLDMPHEENPALGVRGFRLVRDHRDFIVDQLASLAEAKRATGRDVWVMAPMVATAEEASEFASLAKAAGDFKVGIMVEVPAIVQQISELAGVVDFISVGTNDLSQYLFGADRQNSALGGLLNHWQPALIRTLAKIANDASAAAISTGVCGESASDPAFAIVLAGLGFTSVSASPTQVDAVRSALAAVSLSQAKSLAGQALAAKSPSAAKSAIVDGLARL
jgi:phosphotransferase system enzyme I (PtsI)